MNATELQAQLLKWTVAHAGHDEHRQYIGLSGIGDCERVIYDKYVNGNTVDDEALLRLGLGYDMERILVTRLTGLGVYCPGKTISLYGGLVQGHTDGETADGDLLEIKSVALTEHIRERLPRRVEWQVQAYLHYGRFPRAHVIYIARDSGALSVIGVEPDVKLAGLIVQKVGRLVQAVKAQRRPNCTCGKCDRSPLGTHRSQP